MRQKILNLDLSMECRGVLLSLLLMQECGHDEKISKGIWSITADMSIEKLDSCIKELLKDGFLSTDKPMSVLEDNYVPVSDYGLVICLEGVA